MYEPIDCECDCGDGGAVEALFCSAVDVIRIRLKTKSEKSGAGKKGIWICCVRDNFNWYWVIYIYYGFSGNLFHFLPPRLVQRNFKKQRMKIHKSKLNWIV